jgi:hypothetical protein
MWKCRQEKEPATAHAIAGAGITRLRRKCSDKEMIAFTLAAVERLIANGKLGDESAKTTEWRWRLISVSNGRLMVCSGMLFTWASAKINW